MSALPPFLPFARPALDEAAVAAVAQVLRSGWLSGGPRVGEFEAMLSELFGGRPVRSFNSGTAALEVALRIAGIGPGDEVITTPLSWVATANVILATGAEPVFVDVDAHTRNLDLDRVEAAITPRTRAIMPVFLAGLPLDMDRLYDIARRHGLRVVEDAAQAIGSSWHGRRIGSFGDLICFSFQANKNITTGEGGCLVLSDAGQAGLAEQYRLQGVKRQGLDGMDVSVAGGKYNLTDIAAAIGITQLPRLEWITERRRTLARQYFQAFGSDFEARYNVFLPPADFESGNWHMFQILLPPNVVRAELMTRLLQANIGTGVHYPAIHLFTLYRQRGFRPGMFPVAEALGRRLLTLPLFPAMHDEDVQRVVAALQDALEEGSRP